MFGTAKYQLRRRVPRLSLTGAACIIALLASTVARVPVRAQASPAAEHEVKAAFLFNIAKYAEWSAQALPAGAPITIGVLGDEPFGSALNRLVQGRKVNARDIVVVRAARLSELKNAQVVFIGPSERDRAPQICTVAESWSALTIGDTTQTEPFTAVNFAMNNGRIVFTVNLDAARRGNVRISSKLLHFAKEVRGTGPAGKAIR